MSNKLSQEVIAARMVELRNLRRLHATAREREIAKDARITELEAIVVTQQATIETLLIQVAELQTMVFGKKKRPPSSGSLASPLQPLVAKVVRSTDSYRRPIPPAAAITAEVAVPLPETCACGGDFDQTKTTTHDRYQQDIPLPELTPDYRAQLVTKYAIARGVCAACGKATSAKDLGGAQVVFGSNVRLLVTHLVSVGGMSYAQVASLLFALYGFSVSDGEIANILQRQHKAWLPAYKQLKANIRAAPVVHTDETSWAIQDLQGAGYAWVLAAANSPEVYYELAESRGAPVVKALFGQDTDTPFAGIRISDDYGLYRNPKLPGRQQLCWAHPYRSIRDVRYNANLPKEQLPATRQWYEDFAAIYQDLRLYLSQPYDSAARTTQSNELWQRIQALASQPAPNNGEPDKLTKLKAQLLRAGQDRLLVCLPEDTPCDNNRAERDLRQLVLKRKRSFGSKSQQGANALATVLSLCTTTWRSNPTGYFGELALLG